MFKTYSELKNIALRCKDKSKGKMINQYFRIWYNASTDTVELHSRWQNGFLISSTDINGLTTIYPSNNDLCQSTKIKLYQYHRITISSIQSNKGIKRYHHNFIDVGLMDRRVYIPGKTIVCGNSIYSIADYKQLVINKKWNQAYTQKSKINRAAITTLNNIVPFDDDPNNNHTNHRKSIGKYISPDKRTSVVDILMSDEKMNAEHLEDIRNLLGFNNLNKKWVNIRTSMQKLANDERMLRAELAGETETHVVTNDPR